MDALCGLLAPPVAPVKSTSKGSSLARGECLASKSAVSLAWLKRYAAEHRLQQRGLTSTQLILEHVVDRTVHAQCAFTDLMLASTDAAERAAVSQGRPYFFVSHARSRPFAETLASLCHHFQPEQQRLWRRRADGEALPVVPDDDVFLWLDVFAANHHHGDLGPGAAPSLAEEVQYALHDAEETLLVLDPYGTVLQRIWCLYEVWQTCRAGPGKLLRLLVGDIGNKELKEAFNGLDVSRAEAARDADRALLLDAIRRALASPDLMTREVKDGLVRAALAQLPASASSPASSAAAFAIVTASSASFVPSAARAAAAATAGDAFFACSAAGNGGTDAKEQQPQPQSQAWSEAEAAEASCKLHLAAMLCHLNGWLDNARPLYERALAAHERAHGADHPDALRVLQGLVSLLEGQGRYTEAEALLSRVLAGRETRLGADHPDTLSAASDLASVLRAQGKYRRAEALSRRAFEGRCRQLGWEHGDTLAAAHALAGLLQVQGRDGEALALHERALEGHERLLGREHVRTLESMSGLSATLESMGRYDEAEALMRRAVESSERAVGPRHRRTTSLMSNLAGVLEAQGKSEEAEQLQRRALEASRDGSSNKAVAVVVAVGPPERPEAEVLMAPVTPLPGCNEGRGRFAGAGVESPSAPGRALSPGPDGQGTRRGGGAGAVPCLEGTGGVCAADGGGGGTGSAAAPRRSTSSLVVAAQVEEEDDPKKAARRAVKGAAAKGEGATGGGGGGVAVGERACSSVSAAGGKGVAAGSGAAAATTAATAAAPGCGWTCGLLRFCSPHGKVVPVAC